jgi:(S)-ureidoglycine aminohydrolase
MRQEGALRPRFTLITPSNMFASRVTGWTGAEVFKLVTPRNGTAQFSQHLVRLSAGGGHTGDAGSPFEHFLYLLEGEVTWSVGGERVIAGPGSYAYLPVGAPLDLTAGADAVLTLIRRRYVPLEGVDAPAPRSGNRAEHPADLTDVDGLVRRELIPVLDPAHDFAMSLLHFGPGVTLGRVEIHDEEHGLLMVAGTGTYMLHDQHFEVGAGDFIYMAPYCPQAFLAAAPDGAEYLLYKDTYRDSDIG